MFRSDPDPHEDGIRWAMEHRRVAMIGASDDPWRPSNPVFSFLLDHGFAVIPVNPVLHDQGGEVHGVPAVASLMDIAGHIDWVDIFRRAQALPVVWRDVQERREAHGDVDLWWGQLSVTDPHVEAEVRAAGIRVVADRCPAQVFPGRFRGPGSR